MSYPGIPVKEVLSIVTQFIDNEYPTAYKFFRFCPVDDEEPHIIVQLSGRNDVQGTLQCRTPGWTNAEIITEILSIVHNLVNYIQDIVKNIFGFGLVVCQDCVCDLSKYPQLVLKACINNTARRWCACSVKWGPQSTIAKILEESFERHQNVSNLMAPILPMPICEEILEYFVA